MDTLFVFTRRTGGSPRLLVVLFSAVARHRSRGIRVGPAIALQCGRRCHAVGLVVADDCGRSKALPRSQSIGVVSTDNPRTNRRMALVRIRTLPAARYQGTKQVWFGAQKFIQEYVASALVDAGFACVGDGVFKAVDAHREVEHFVYISQNSKSKGLLSGEIGIRNERGRKSSAAIPFAHTEARILNYLNAVSQPCARCALVLRS
jgi:hypothetical protein